MSRISPKDLRRNSMTQWQANRAEKRSYWEDQIRRWRERGLRRLHTAAVIRSIVNTMNSERSYKGISMDKELVIKPPKGLAAVKLKEIWEYRELFYFLIWRDVKVRYKQTVRRCESNAWRMMRSR